MAILHHQQNGLIFFVRRMITFDVINS